MTRSREIPESNGPGREDLTEVRNRNLVAVLEGRYDHFYSNYLLKGKLGKYFPFLWGAAVFPNVTGSTFQLFSFSQKGDFSVPHCIAEITHLILPARVRGKEQRNFRDVLNKGDQILELIERQHFLTDMPDMPSVILVFGKPRPQDEESACMYHPTIVPPSAALRRTQEHARAGLAEMN